MSTLRLPGIEAVFSLSFSDPLLLVAGGKRPSLPWMESLFPGKTIWCADSGLVHCQSAGFLPSRLIGDGDSTPPEMWDEAVGRGVSVTRHPAEKDLTDLQLALFTAGSEMKGRAVVVTGCWGGRFDHLWANVFSALWAKEQGVRVLTYADEQECLFILEAGERIDLTRYIGEGMVVSLLPLTSECFGVDLLNARWELKDSLLLQKRPYTVSNRPEDNKNISVTLQKGILGVYCGWF